MKALQVTVKDNISMTGVKATCGSKMLADYVPVYNATVIDKLKAAGVTVTSEPNIKEFDMGKPAALLGLTGIKPTYGAVSRYGLIANAPSMEQIGAVGQNIHDCAAILEIISGPDNMDSTCVIDKPFKFDIDKEHNKLDGVKIGALTGCPAAEEFKEAGAVVEEIEMPMLDCMEDIYFIISCAEMSSNMARYDGLKYGYRADASTLAEVYKQTRSEGFGYEVKRRIMLGNFFLSAGQYDVYYKKALQARTIVKNNFNDLFKKFDIIATPLTGSNLYIAPANLAGLPTVTLPPGFQLIGNSFEEEKLINAASVYQNMTQHHKNAAINVNGISTNATWEVGN